MGQNSNCDKTQKLNLWQKKKQVKLWQSLKYDQSQFLKNKTLKGAFSKNILTPWQPIKCSLGSVFDSRNVLSMPIF